VVVAVGRCVCKCEAGEGAEGSISGAPSEMGVESGEGRWCDGADEGVVVVGRCIRKREAGEGFGLKGQNRAVVARFRVHRTKRRRGMVRRGGVVECMRWRRRWGCALAKREAGRGFWAKTRNRAVVARFRARRVKRRWGMVRRGGVVVRTRWWWWWSCALVKREPERGLGRNPKPSRCGSI